METKTEKLQKTTKKQKFVGFKEFIDAETGEIIPMQVNNVEDRDYNFHKFWLRNFVEQVDGITNKKLRLTLWIIENLNSENQLLFTFQQMAEKTGLHYDTVVKTMQHLQKGDPPFLKKIHSGLYQVNPDIIYKGSHRNRMGIIYQFGSIASKDALEKKKAFDEQEEAKAKAKAKATDTTVADTSVTPEPITGVVTRTIEMSETKDTETETINSMENTNNETTTESATETTTQRGRRTGRAGRNKPTDWEEIKAKILSGEISRNKYCKENKMSPNTLSKWLKESAA